MIAIATLPPRQPSAPSLSRHPPWRSSIPYDDRDGQIWLNGELVAWREAKVARADPWPALWQLGVRGRALLCRPDLQEHRAQPAADRQRPHPGLRGALHGGRARRRQGGRGRQDGLQGLLCPPARLARLRADGRLGAAVADQRRDRGLGVGCLLQRPAPDARHLRPAGSEHGTGARQGRRALHDLHHLQACRRGQGLRRRADARLSRLPRRDHGRQPVPGHRRRDPHARRPTASSTASPAGP